MSDASCAVGASSPNLVRAKSSRRHLLSSQSAARFSNSDDWYVDDDDVVVVVAVELEVADVKTADSGAIARDDANAGIS